ncbi:MAG TPA: MFS transporter [Pseudonocardiaceae bacterium]|jgi:EmrB/QacA subfamily drug resistance transporter|nr:MFS transporter [Pseudonocardiaceae bacterium]
MTDWRTVLLAERIRPEAVRSSANGWWFAVATVCLGAFMGQLDASIVTLTYPALRAEFHTSLAAVEWVSLSYLLTLVAALIPVGRLADARGRKLLYLYGFVVFTLASALCGLAPSLLALVLFRVVQAAGAAMLQANSVALVTISAPRPRVRAALGVQAAAQALGLALGPTLGGILVTAVGWRWVFVINVPVGVLGVLAGYYLLPRTREHTPITGFDWRGLTLLAAVTTTGLLAVSAASGLHLPAVAVVALFVLAALAGVAFVRRQRSAVKPLVDLALLAERAVRSGLLAALGGYLVLFGPLVLVPIVLTQRGYPAAGTGLVLTALPAGFALAATLADRVLPAGWTDRTRCTLGTALCLPALAAALLLPLGPAELVPELAVLGLGLGVFTPANNAMIMTAIPARSAGTGGGLVNMTRALGTALGVALVTLTLHLAHDTGAGPALITLLVAAALTLVATRATVARRRAS